MKRAVPIAKTLLFTVFVPGTVALYIPHRILLSRGPSDFLPLAGLRYLGLPMLVAGAAGYLWCAWDFATTGRGTPAPIDPPKKLIVRGLYRYVRNPMYVSVLLVVIGQALLFRSRALLEYTAAVFIFFFLFVFLYEEPTLARKFGQSYEKYRDRVPRWVPRIRKETRKVEEP
jgi:protein-S-isoprenylcysteine O-methyltransferase Ste14